MGRTSCEKFDKPDRMIYEGILDNYACRVLSPIHRDGVKLPEMDESALSNGSYHVEPETVAFTLTSHHQQTRPGA